MVAHEESASHAANIYAQLGKPRSQNQSRIALSVSYRDAIVWICRHAIYEIRSELLRAIQDSAYGMGKQTDI